MNLVGPARPSSPVAAYKPVAVVERAANELEAPWPTRGSRRVVAVPTGPRCSSARRGARPERRGGLEAFPSRIKRTYWLVERS
jgi:hypothetical protein